MSAIVLYEILHCLAAACLAVRLFCHAHSPAQTKRYVLAGAAACLFLGDVYWLAHLIIRGEPPAIFSACDVAYIGFSADVQHRFARAWVRSVCVSGPSRYGWRFLLL